MQRSKRISVNFVGKLLCFNEDFYLGDGLIPEAKTMIRAVAASTPKDLAFLMFDWRAGRHSL